jgi:hypothetical protein
MKRFGTKETGEAFSWTPPNGWSSAAPGGPVPGGHEPRPGHAGYRRRTRQGPGGMVRFSHKISPFGKRGKERAMAGERPAAEPLPGPRPKSWLASRNWPPRPEPAAVATAAQPSLGCLRSDQRRGAGGALPVAGPVSGNQLPTNFKVRGLDKCNSSVGVPMACRGAKAAKRPQRP